MSERERKGESEKMSFMEKIFGDLNAKEVKKVAKIADKVEAYDQQMQEMSDQ